MNITLILIIVSIISFILIIFFVYVYITNKKKESKLFDQDSSGLFRKFFRRLNPFIFSEQEYTEDMEGIGENNENLKNNMKNIMLSSNKNSKDTSNKYKNKKIDELSKENLLNNQSEKNKPMDSRLQAKLPEITNNNSQTSNASGSANTKPGDKSNSVNITPNPSIKPPALIKAPTKPKTPSKLPYEGPKSVNFQTIVEAVKDEELLTILKKLKEKYNKFLEKKTLNKNFNSYEDLLDFLKTEIKLFLKDMHEALKSEISTLRRAGKDTNEYSIKLMSVPLKIKIYESNPSVKNFNNVLEIIRHIEDGINSLKINTAVK
jgi:hypothetical protein